MQGIHHVCNGRLNAGSEVMRGDKTVGVDAVSLEVLNNGGYYLVMVVDFLAEGMDSVVQYLATGAGKGPKG